jgi:hypothetical protein
MFEKCLCREEYIVALRGTASDLSTPSVKVLALILPAFLQLWSLPSQSAEASYFFTSSVGSEISRLAAPVEFDRPMPEVKAERAIPVEYSDNQERGKEPTAVSSRNLAWIFGAGLVGFVILSNRHSV